MKTDRLPHNLLTTGEVIAALRLGQPEEPGVDYSHVKALRQLRYLRVQKAFPFHCMGQRTFLYPRAGIKKFLAQTLVAAA